jgi:hypothetical protein
MSNGTLREFHTAPGDGQTPPQLLHTDLATVPGMVLVFDAYADASRYQHAIVGADSGQVAGWVIGTWRTVAVVVAWWLFRPKKRTGQRHIKKVAYL